MSLEQIEQTLQELVSNRCKVRTKFIANGITANATGVLKWSRRKDSYNNIENPSNGGFFEWRADVVTDIQSEIVVNERTNEEREEITIHLRLEQEG